MTSSKYCGAATKRMISKAMGGNGRPTRSSVTPIRAGSGAQLRRAGGAGEPAPPGKGVPVGRRPPRFGTEEDSPKPVVAALNGHAIERRHHRLGTEEDSLEHLAQHG